MDAGRWHEAAGLLERALRESYKVPGPKRQLAYAFTRLGEAKYKQSGRFLSPKRSPQADPLLHQAVKAFHNALSLFDLDAETTRYNDRQETAMRLLSNSYDYLESRHECIRYGRRCLELRRRHARDNDRETYNLLTIMANASDYVDDPKASLIYNKRALILSRRLNAPDEPRLVADLLVMALRYANVKQTEKAIEMLDEALDLYCALKERQAEGLADVRKFDWALTFSLGALEAQGRGDQARRVRQQAIQCGFLPRQGRDESPGD